MKKLYKFIDFRLRNDDYDIKDLTILFGILVAEEKDLQNALEYWKNNDCGKGESEFIIVTDDQDFISKFEKFNLESGYNPVKEEYLNENII